MVPVSYNLRSLRIRRATSILTALGVALVVIVVVVLLSLIGGVRQSLQVAADPRVWILLSRGISAEPESYISHQQFGLLRSRPEVAVTGRDNSLVSGELAVQFNAAIKRPANHFYPATLRGVQETAREVHPNVRIVQGRWLEPGREELLIGKNLLAMFPELAPGATFRYGRRNWTVVGVISDKGSVHESEFWADIDVLEQDAHFDQGFSSFHVVLKPGMEESFKKALTDDARLTVDAVNEVEYYAEQTSVADQLSMLVLIVSAIIGAGAAFGGMNTMYGAVVRRAREIGVLRALGFRRRDVVLSFLVESELLALAGGIGGTLASLLLIYAAGLDRRMFRVGAITFSSRLSLSACAYGLLAALLVGAIGGLLPAFRAARTPITEALRRT